MSSEYMLDSRRADTERGRAACLAHSIHSDNSYLFGDAINRLYSITRIYANDELSMRQSQRQTKENRRLLFLVSGTGIVITPEMSGSIGRNISINSLADSRNR